ncbi:hypothetical protein E3T37_09905 [Cryobacterium sp. TMT2-10]|uniref:hypothetical protein n=1 Tax=Cryobacterium sp. TMT2-10 TaxID=1259244 RepID=UPI00106D870F|nr:hypothetical protein [Cryobacterium sp. TMT2-10]TFD38362.1 hypothetical protein E3T37_09905 [Cryobacterium sp. TMT2-10]
MHDNRVLLEARIERVIRERIKPAVYRRTAPLAIASWTVDDEPVPFDVAVGQSYEHFTVGGAWGKPWGTVWFHLTGGVC